MNKLPSRFFTNIPLLKGKTMKLMRIMSNDLLQAFRYLNPVKKNASLGNLQNKLAFNSGRNQLPGRTVGSPGQPACPCGLLGIDYTRLVV